MEASNEDDGYTAVLDVDEAAWFSERIRASEYGAKPTGGNYPDTTGSA
ncbi:hypothetical protein [Haloarcula marina]|nr:hypothetical protein [Halomicroarcula marina]